MAYTTINKATDYFNTKLYTGNGNSNHAQTGVGFQPDLLWNKSRSSGDNHLLFDAVRGSTKSISSDTTSAEATRDSTFLTSFDSDGFTVGSNGNINGSGATFANWCWKAGTTSGITTDGNTTITPSSYSFNQTAGFSILSYTGNGVEGAKLAHGLGTTPAMVIIKRYSTAGDWVVYHKNLTATNSVFLNYTDGQASRSPNGYIYSPDATNITLSNHGDINTNGTTTVAYAFAEKTGFSKIGSYTGNGSTTNGTFVYTGFKPAWIMIKRYNASGHDWVLIDDKRLGYNPDNNTLLPNTSAVEQTDNRIDILSNGFKHYNNNGSENENNGTYIYMCFAEAPLVGSNNVPCTAR